VPRKFGAGKFGDWHRFEEAPPMTKTRKKTNRWSHKVKTVSTFPQKDLFTKNAETIARAMASKKVSPKGIGSGIRMVQFFINRPGKNLPAGRKEELEKAKHLLQDKARKRKEPGKRKQASR
jgi:hypothetical protein